jgi:membrane associated rhomboid family serine protease
MTPVAFLFLAINVVVFLAWTWLGQHPFMVANFLVSYDAIAEGRWWTLISSEFSHILFLHFFLNMYVLTTFGVIVESVIGSVRFFVFYLAAGVIASLSHAAVSAYVIGNPSGAALGASGALSGVIIVFSLLLPQARLLFLGLIPMPAIVGAAVFVGLDLVGLFFQAQGGGLPIGHGAHLGGAAVGALYYVLAVRPLRVEHARRRDYSDVATWRRLISQTAERERDGW